MDELRDRGYDSEDSAEKEGEGDAFDVWGRVKADDADSSCVMCQAINMLGLGKAGAGVGVGVDIEVEVDADADAGAGVAHVWLVSVMYAWLNRPAAPPNVITRDPVRCDAAHMGDVYMYTLYRQPQSAVFVMAFN